MRRELDKRNPHWHRGFETELFRIACRDDFWAFFLYAFGAGLNPKGQRWIDPPVHEPIARWFQAQVQAWRKEREETRLVGKKPKQRYLAVVMQREIGKTTLITRAGQTWLHLLDPDFSSYTGSEKIELSAKMLGGIKAVLDGSDRDSWFTHLYGNWATDAPTWRGNIVIHSARRNTSRQDPSFAIFAVETSITGGHPDAIFFDDPISYERLESDSDWMNRVHSQVDSMIPVIQSDGLVVWCGTRYSGLDHFGRAFREEGVASLSGMDTGTIEVDKENGLWHVYFMAGRDRSVRTREHPDGVPTTPKVWDEDRMRRFAKRNPARYAAQIMNDPSSSESNPITLDQIDQCVVEREQVPWNSLDFVICCDHAFADPGKIGGKDETVMLVSGHAKNGSGDVYFVEGYGSPVWRGEDLARRIVALIQRYRSLGRRIRAITNDLPMAGAKGLWRSVLLSRFNEADEPMPLLYELSRGGQKKEQRLIESVQFWIDGHVRVLKNAPGLQRLKEQMGRLGEYAANKSLKIDWADAFCDNFHPEVYRVMRRPEPVRAQRSRGALPLPVPGLKIEDFQSEEDDEWLSENPRPPIS